MRNWSRHVTFSAERSEAPSSVGELRRLVATSTRIHALGTGHSFNEIADTSGVHVSLHGLPDDVDVDVDNGFAWLPSGMRYGEAARILDDRGLALHNLASLGHISVGGSVATGTHGSGDRNLTLAAVVVRLEVVTAEGDLVVLSRDDDPDLIAGCIVGLGALGVVTRVGVLVQPRFDVRQYVIEDVPLDAVVHGFDEIFGSAYSVSFFTPWDPSRTGQVWMKRRDSQDVMDGSRTWPAGVAATQPRHPLGGHDPVNCTQQGGAAGPWHERLPHFRLDFTPSSGDELQTEYLVDRAAAPGLLQALDAIAPRLAPLVQVSEVRTMRADDLWLSGAYGRDTVGIHFTWHKTPEVLDILPELDELLGQGDGRPHWGKLFRTRPAALAQRYPRFDDFRELADRMDPDRKFRNDFLDALLGP
ncbi:MAG: D-arabinono-1,4-lactone oxidase [Actinomycetota bacterium]|nr:D-arabinono-1,4-lactone oxidase [Actinomycetota bacterium]